MLQILDSLFFPTPQPPFLASSNESNILSHLFTFVDARTLQSLSCVCRLYRRVIFTTNDLFPKIIRGIALIDRCQLKKRNYRQACFWPWEKKDVGILKIKYHNAKVDCSKMIKYFWQAGHVRQFADLCGQLFSGCDEQECAEILRKYIPVFLRQRRFQLLFALHKKHNALTINRFHISREVFAQFFFFSQFNFWKNGQIDSPKWDQLFKNSPLAADNWIGYCQLCQSQEEWFKKIPAEHFAHILTDLAQKIYSRECDPLLATTDLKKKCEIINCTEELFKMFDRLMASGTSVYFWRYHSYRKQALNLKEHFFEVSCRHYGLR